MAPATGFNIMPSGIGLRQNGWPFTKLAANPWESSSTGAEACGFCALSAGTGSAQWARSSAEEHYVDIVGVTGSIPVAPTIISNWGIKDFLRTPKPFIRLARQAGKQGGSTSGYLGAVSPAGPTTFPPRGLTKRAIIVRFRIRAPSNKNYLYFPAVLSFDGGGLDLSASTAIIPQD